MKVLPFRRVQLIDLRTLEIESVSDIVFDVTEPGRFRNLRFYTEAPYTRERQLQQFKMFVADPRRFVFLIVCVENREPVGSIGLHEYDEHGLNARLSAIIFADRFDGQGYFREAFGQLLRLAFKPRELGGIGLHKVYVNLFKENRTARAFYEKQGFHLDGTLREHYENGGWHDMVQYSLLEREWLGCRVRRPE